MYAHNTSIPDTTGNSDTLQPFRGISNGLQDVTTCYSLGVKPVIRLRVGSSTVPFLLIEWHFLAQLWPG